VAQDVRTIQAGPDDAGRTVQRLMHDRLGVSNAEAKGLIASGCVARNRRTVVKPDDRVAAGDRVDVTAESGRKYRTMAAHGTRGGEGWRVVHEDDDVIVIDKDAGVLTVPTASPVGDSLEEMLLASYKKRGHKNPTLYVVHRIDRFTSGLVVFARNHPAAMELRRQFKERTPERIYLAAAEGRVGPDRGRLTHALAENPKSLKIHVVAMESEGRLATSRYRVLERFPHATLLEVTLETGRRNQIRVQLAAEGHPVVGDFSYGRPSDLIPRVALHAHRLSFAAPRGRKRLQFESPVPRDFKRLLTKLKGGASMTPAPADGASLGEEDEHARVGKQVVRPAKRGNLRVAREPEQRNSGKMPRQRR
jgi:23S rRNA pseudouridine1911/1915/1917 synthase